LIDQVDSPGHEQRETDRNDQRDNPAGIPGQQRQRQQTAEGKAHAHRTLPRS
jgi:hypothetical protein